MRRLRAGLIGLGMMGRQHARVLASLPGVDFVGTFDPVVEEDASAQNRPVFKELGSLIQLGLDYAVVAAPTQHHLGIATQLAESRINALIEKPLSHDTRTGTEISRRFSENNLVGAVGHIERFNPAVIEAKRRLEMLGPLFQVATRRQGPFPGRILDVGVVKDLATHDIDLTRWVTQQEYVDISAKVSHRSGRSNEDLVVASGILDGGTVVNHVVNWLSPRKERIIVLIGENGSFEIDTLNADLTYFANGTSENSWDDLAHFRGVSEGDVIRFAISKREPLVVEHENFRDVLLGKDSRIATIEEGLKAVEIAEAMLSSAKDGPVTLT